MVVLRSRSGGGRGGGGSQYKRRGEERRGTKSMKCACLSVDIRMLGFERKESVKVSYLRKHYYSSKMRDLQTAELLPILPFRE